MSAPQFRVTDTGLRSGRENIAFDQAMVDAHQNGEIPDTLRFIGFKPVVLVGRHQALSQEVHADFCRNNNIDIGRRITGGGAIYMDEGQMGWAIVCRRESLGGGSLTDVTTKICTAAAAGLSRLGLEARYRPRNDIEVGGRKISGTGGFFDGDTLIYQGTVLGAVNPDVMFNALNVPASKLEKRDLSDASRRVTTLTEELGGPPDWAAVKTALAEGFAEGLGVKMVAGPISDAEERRANQLFLEEIGTDEFVYDIDDPARDAEVRVGSHQGAGGNVTAHVRLEGARNERLREVLIAGDFFITPPRIIMDLEASLRRLSVENIEQGVADFFESADVGMLSVAPADFAAAIRAAVTD
ncbi:MAG: lipoate--protein ligase family protein [Parvularcula sp.]